MTGEGIALPGSGVRVSYQAALIGVIAIIVLVALSGNKRTKPPDENAIMQDLLNTEIERLIREVRLIGLRTPGAPGQYDVYTPNQGSLLSQRYWNAVRGVGAGPVPMTPHFGVAFP